MAVEKGLNGDHVKLIRNKGLMEAQKNVGATVRESGHVAIAFD